MSLRRAAEGSGQKAKLGPRQVGRAMAEGQAGVHVSRTVGGDNEEEDTTGAVKTD